jgi:hypothetical protein
VRKIRGKLILGLLIVVGLIAVFFVFLYKPQLLLGPHAYAMGEEIKSYPVDEMAISITYWKTTEQFHEIGFGWFDSENGTTLVLFNFTIRNIASKEISLWDYEFSAKLNSVEPPMLKYGNYYASDKAAVGTGIWTQRLLIYEPTKLMPNQSTKGLLIYKILDGYQPTQLVYPNGDSPQFIIKIS